AVGVLMLAACSNAPGAVNPDQGDDQTTESGPVTLQVMGVERSFTADAIAAFEDQHQDIAVEFTNQQPVFEDGSVQTMLRSGSGADVLDISTGPARIGALIASDLLPEIDDVWEAAGLEQNMIPYASEQVGLWSGDHRYEV